MPKSPPLSREDAALKLWDVLGSLRVFEDGQVDKKGRFNYLKWQAAWRLFRENFPDSGCTFTLYTDADGNVCDVMYYKSGTTSVTCTVYAVIDENRFEMTHTYPILNHQNRDIKNPGAFDINTARMRAKVKTLALMGLGLHIYEGAEDDSSLSSETTSESASAGVKRVTNEAKPKPKKKKPAQEKSAVKSNVDGFVEEMIDLGVNIKKVNDYVLEERKCSLADLQVGDLMTLRDYINETIDSGYWS